jgi:hypothetical protein
MIIMRIPEQVSDRVKEAPAQVLRAVFAGIGQVLLVADRIKSRAADDERARASAAAKTQPTQATPPTQPTQPAQARREAAAPARQAPTPRLTPRWRSLDETGNVRLLTRDDDVEAKPPAAAPKPEPADDILATAEPEPADDIPAVAEPETVTEAPATEPEPAAQVAGPAAPAQEAVTPAEQPSGAGLSVLPVANYDGLTIASLRARLRNLDPPQLRVLIDYEKAHAGRGDVLTMFERRIAKLESEA